MRRLISLTIFLAVFAAIPLAAQATSGHVYLIRYHEVHQGQDQAYAEAYATFVRPVFDALKERGLIVSYLDLTQFAGSGKTTHILITEYASLAAVEEAQGSLEEVSQEVLGRSMTDEVAGLAEIRDFLRQELYTAVVP